MPLYEYVCKDCGAHFDALRSFKDADKAISCKSCFSEQTVRKISVFYAQAEGHTITASSGGCAGCGGGSCASCGGHHN